MTNPHATFLDAHLHATEDLLPHLASIRCIANASSPQEFSFLRRASLPTVTISVGIHPWEAEARSWNDMEPCLRAADVIGEIGLDATWCTTAMDIQRAVFRKQLELACEMSKPVILHTKGMEQEVLETIRSFPNRYLVHWYSCESLVDDYLDLGCWFTIGPSAGIDPTVTSLAQRIPENKLLIESDGLEGIAWAQGASLTPADYPTAMERHLNTLAALRHENPERLLQVMKDNLERFIHG